MTSYLSIFRLFSFALSALILLSSCESAPGTIADLPPEHELPKVSEAASDTEGEVDGIYKGVLTTEEESGRFRIDIRNTDPDNISLSGVFEGEEFSAFGQEQRTEEGYSYTFQGESRNDAFSFRFSTEISIRGEIDDNNTILIVEGEPIAVNMLKELPDELVEVYEGSYSGDERGNWNFVLRGDRLSGYYAGESEDRFSGRLSTEGELLATGRDRHMVARGRVSEDGDSGGNWHYDAGRDFPSPPPRGLFEEIELEEENRFTGERSL